MGHLEHQPVQHILFLQLHKFNFKTGVTQNEQQSYCRMLLVALYQNNVGTWMIAVAGL